MAFSLFSQNLVPNPGFEDYIKCPTGISQFNKVKNWFSPTKGTPDYYNACAAKKTKVGVPFNAMGTRQPKTGSAYAGIILFNNFNRDDEREYIEVKLQEPLKKDSVYLVSFYVCLADSSSFATDAIGAYISADPLQNTGWCTLKANPQISNPQYHILNDTGWMRITGAYKAAGGEQYLTVGNFFEPDQTTIKKNTRSWSGYAYYFIDDVSVELAQYPPPKPVKILRDSTTMKSSTPFRIVLDSSITLNNIFFETDKAVLLPPSFKELDSLVGFLALHKSFRISISGYTDNQGSDNYNMILSEARAKSVAQYLIFKGIDGARVGYKGYGNTHPVSTNDTPEGRQKNRRVEFKISVSSK